MEFQLPLIGLTERRVPQFLSDMLVRPCYPGCYFNESALMGLRGCSFASNDFNRLGLGNIEYIECGEICIHPEYNDCSPEEETRDEDVLV